MQVNKIKKQAAYTFAELMLTLTILGVVVAMTVPTLVKNNHRTEMENLLKKSYGIINQTVDMALSDVDSARNIPDDMSKWNLSNASTVMDRYFRPFLSVQKVCPAGNGDCFANTTYRLLDGTASHNFSDPAGLNASYSVLLNDGIAMQIAECNGSSCHVHVDLNGPKDPNVVGYDHFEFIVNKVNKKVEPYSYGNSDAIMQNGWKITQW